VIDIVCISVIGLVIRHLRQHVCELFPNSYFIDAILISVFRLGVRLPVCLLLLNVFPTLQFNCNNGHACNKVYPLEECR
jgi:hypothetical protein